MVPLVGRGPQNARVRFGGNGVNTKMRKVSSVAPHKLDVQGKVGIEAVAPRLKQALASLLRSSLRGAPTSLLVQHSGFVIPRGFDGGTGSLESVRAFSVNSKIIMRCAAAEDFRRLLRALLSFCGEYDPFYRKTTHRMVPTPRINGSAKLRSWQMPNP